MDEEYVDNAEKSRRVIDDIQAVDPKEPMILKLVRKRIDLHYWDLTAVKLGHRISSREHIEELWTPPYCPKKPKELWLQDQMKPEAGIWIKFRSFWESR